MELDLTVYFLFNPKTQLVKIGKTEDFKSRYRTHCREAGCELEILLLIEGDDTERQLLRYFASDLRLRKEWFQLSPRLVELIALTKSKGRLVFPDGEIKKPLLVDYRREVKEQGKKVDLLEKRILSLQKQTEIARSKREEFRGLANQTEYYKRVAKALRDHKKTKANMILMWGSLAVSLLAAIPLIVGEWVSSFYTDFYKMAALSTAVSATLFIRLFDYGYFPKRLRKWTSLFCWFYRFIALIAWLSIVSIYLN